MFSPKTQARKGLNGNIKCKRYRFEILLEDLRDLTDVPGVAV
jgi:hypothetical protein